MHGQRLFVCGTANNEHDHLLRWPTERQFGSDKRKLWIEWSSFEDVLENLLQQTGVLGVYVFNALQALQMEMEKRAMSGRLAHLFQPRFGTLIRLLVSLTASMIFTLLKRSPWRACCPAYSSIRGTTCTWPPRVFSTFSKPTVSQFACRS